MNANMVAAAQLNQLLGSLTRANLQLIAQDLQRCELRVRDHLLRRGEAIDRVYFPISCVLSTVAQGGLDELVEVAAVGSEGVAGFSLFLGVDYTSNLETFVQVPGQALTLRARQFTNHLKRSPHLSGVLGHYTQALLCQIAQSSACNRWHSPEARCARWLLMTQDRVRRDSFELTHEFLSQMLGMRPATVSEVAANLQTAGLIRYVREIVNITDRRGLEERSCECYQVIRDEYTRLLGSRHH